MSILAETVLCGNGDYGRRTGNLQRLVLQVSLWITTLVQSLLTFFEFRNCTRYKSRCTWTVEYTRARQLNEEIMRLAGVDNHGL